LTDSIVAICSLIWAEGGHNSEDSVGMRNNSTTFDILIWLLSLC